MQKFLICPSCSPISGLKLKLEPILERGSVSLIFLASCLSFFPLQFPAPFLESASTPLSSLWHSCITFLVSWLQGWHPFFLMHSPGHLHAASLPAWGLSWRQDTNTCNYALSLHHLTSALRTALWNTKCDFHPNYLPHMIGNA